MPYQVESHCPHCASGDTFIIGQWTTHRGVFVCPECRALVNVPLASGACPGCGHKPALADYYDYAYAIPYLGGKLPFPAEPGPPCPRCGEAALTFETTMHINMRGTVLGVDQDTLPWLELDTLEKAIFILAMMSVTKEYPLDPRKLLRYFRLDLPLDPMLIMQRRFSYPIFLDIRTHFAVQLQINPQGLADLQLPPEEEPPAL